MTKMEMRPGLSMSATGVRSVQPRIQPVVCCSASPRHLDPPARYDEGDASLAGHLDAGLMGINGEVSTDALKSAAKSVTDFLNLLTSGIAHRISPLYSISVFQLTVRSSGTISGYRVGANVATPGERNTGS